ncbi:MAG: FMN-binding glutamate synthase family protein [Bacilli bacterium]
MMKKILLKMMNPIIDDYIIEMFTKEYSKNPYIGITSIQKIGMKNIIDAELRAESGKVLSIPYGSNLNLSPWDKLLLNPKQLFEMPTPNKNDINISVVIGKKCKKPLKLSTPIMITGMSYGGSLSLKMKIALAKASKLIGTVTNTGESVIAKEVRKSSKYVIGQISRANLMKDKDLEQLDAIEVRFGQGAWGGAAESTKYSKDIDEKLRKDWHLKEGEDKKFTARLEGINSKKDLKRLISELKENYDVPIGIKIAASDYIEKELEVITSTNCDYIVIDGSEGGTATAPPTLEDNLGLPTLYALIRAVDYLQKNNLYDNYDLIITGGLSTPGHFLKAIAIGAKAVYIGSILVFVAVHNQAVKPLPYLPPTQLALGNGELKDDLDINLSTNSLYNFFTSCHEEMKLALQAMNKKDIKELSREDLVSIDKNISNHTDIKYVLRKE